MSWWLISQATAAPPIALSAAVQTTAQVGEGGFGHDVRVGLPFTPERRWLVEGISASTFGAGFELRAGVRWYLDEPWSTRGALSLSTSFGASAFPAGPLGSLGLSYDTPIRKRLVARIGLEAIVGEPINGLRASLGLVLPARRPDPIIEVVYIERPPEPVEPEVDVTVTEMVWVPAPVCDWLPAEDAKTLLAQTSTPIPKPKPRPDPEPETTPIVTVIEVPEPEPEPDAEPDADPEPEVAPAASDQRLKPMGEALAAMAVEEDLPFWSPEVVKGVLIVLAHPGDQVLFDGNEVEVDNQGIAMMRREEGPVDIEVSSGGQRQSLKAALVQGHAVWVRAQDPSPSEVFFAYDKSTLSVNSRDRIMEVAQNAADWSFVLQGGYSPEGTIEYNRDLAIARAREVSRALQAAGIPSDRIVFLDPPPPDPNRSPERQRNCRIIPIAPEVDGS